MARGKRAPAAAKGLPSSKKKKSQQMTLFGDSASLQASMTKAHKGTRLLLKSTAIYPRNRVPDGEEDYLFLYVVEKVNDDLKTAVINFADRYVIEGGHQFCNYVSADNGTDGSIEKYDLELLKKDAEVYGVHIARGNKVRNDKLAAEAKAAAEEKIRSRDDVSDLKAKMEQRQDGYGLLLSEFESVGSLQQYIISSGPNEGKPSYKQQFKHSPSGYSFICHRKFGKEAFQSDRYWKAARVIVARQLPGWLRINLIMEYTKMPINDFGPLSKYPREVDMVNRTYAVAASVLGKLPLGVFDEQGMRAYLGRLDSKHTPPHRLERLRLLEVFIDAGVMEWSRILKVHEMCIFLLAN